MNIKNKIFSKKSWKTLFIHLIKLDLKVIASKCIFLIKTKERQLPQSKKITIISTKHTIFIANLLAYFFKELNFNVTKLISPPIHEQADEIYIVICPQMFKNLPKTFLSFQMEQSVSSRWFTGKYFKILKKSFSILDYSQKNIAFLRKNNFVYQQIFYMPVCYIPSYSESVQEKSDEFDVLFYGDSKNKRRQKILDALSKKFKIKVVNNLFGEELYTIIKKAKVVLNIHYYENSLLETTRIFECLSLNTPVVSETSSDIDEFKFLNNLLAIVPENDITAMEIAIERFLKEKNRENDLNLTRSTEMTRFYFYRFLLANKLISYETLSNKCKYFFSNFSKDSLICLSLPETPERRNLFTCPTYYNNFTFFDGIRLTPGWIGCGLSYKYILTYAQKLNLDRITICEDDTLFPSNFNTQIPLVLKYLDHHLGGNWDIFCGLIADLHDDVEISKVDYVDGICYVHLNRMTSMVFNIYNKRVLPLLTSWNHLEESDDNTIDRYLEKKSDLNIITTLPFLIKHRSDGAKSTLWGTENSIYDDLIIRSEQKLRKKVQQFTQNKL